MFDRILNKPPRQSKNKLPQKLTEYFRKFVLAAGFTVKTFRLLL